ncbi:type VI secretion system protein TssA [Arsenophonus nasoniae]|uniref:Type VI secretion system protein TssA n=1 Tax=Arsenophonus nasoniae TaxID=638 RepID=A0AA95K042_9GAMM|nr:type VI secretion system protein TssA [Arsenophonus nasoniae]WGL95039.1 type VI secretion system protein TssA [Arsenophonus nasoniae]
MELTVLDFDRLMLKHSDDLPAGENIEYQPIFEQINQARESDDDLQLEDMWSCEARQTDWRQVSLLCIEVLEKHSKDLQIACWLTQAQAKLHGLAGMAVGVALISRLCETFWPILWPKLDEEDGYGADIRLARLNWLDNRLSHLLQDWPLTDDGKLNVRQWARVQHYEHSVAVNTELRKPLQDDGYFGIADCEESIRHTSSSHVNHLLEQIQTLQTSLLTLQTLLKNFCGENVIVMNDSLHQVEEVQSLLSRFYQDRLSPVMFKEQQHEQIKTDSDTQLNNPSLNRPSSHLENRKQAIEQMLTIAQYFRSNEPTSPVPYLLERAASWANMEIAQWLAEMLVDNDSTLRDMMRVIKGSEN